MKEERTDTKDLVLSQPTLGARAVRLALFSLCALLRYNERSGQSPAVSSVVKGGVCTTSITWPSTVALFTVMVLVEK